MLIMFEFLQFIHDFLARVNIFRSSVYVFRVVSVREVFLYYSDQLCHASVLCSSSVPLLRIRERA